MHLTDSPSAPRRRTTMALTIRRSNPLEYADSLKALMIENEHKAFGAFFDRGYADVVARGGASWLAFDGAGHVQMNVTLFRHDFQFRGRTIAGGMIGNMMAAKEYRTFFPMIALVKQLVRDVKEEGQVDFIYTDPNPGATAIMKGTPFTQAGNLDRCVIPLGDRNLLRHVAARCYSAAQRFKVHGRLADVEELPSAQFDASCFHVPEGTSSRLRPHHSDALYRRRLSGYPGPDFSWYAFRLAGPGTPPDAAMLVQTRDEHRLATIYAIRRRPGVPLAPLIPPLVKRLRKHGALRLQIEVVRDGEFSRELQAVGFRQRNDLLPVYVHALTEQGAGAVQAINEWEITGFDMER